MKKVLLICHRASPVLEKMVGFARERALQPVAISSATSDGGKPWFDTCAKLGIAAAMSATRSIELADIDALLAREPGDYAFAFANWDGQRGLMAELNQRFGANDLTPAAVATVQDKLLFRQTLLQHGLSQLRVMPADSPQALALVADGTPLIVKPRRGVGSLMTARVASASALAHMNQLFNAGIPEEDLFSEFTRGNELIAETFFEGTELSFELIRHQGQTTFWCAHEKTPVEFAGATVLEPGFMAPCVSISAQEVARGFALVEQALDRLALHAGCYHVEMLRNGQGEWEFIEINTRMGGALISDSVLAQYGRHLMGDWMDVLLGRAPAAPTAPRCGVYMQCGFAFGDRRVTRITASSTMRTPDIVRTPGKVGMLASDQREDIATVCLWRTTLARHAEEVAELAGEHYFTLDYAP